MPFTVVDQVHVWVTFEEEKSFSFWAQSLWIYTIPLILKTLPFTGGMKLDGAVHTTVLTFKERSEVQISDKIMGLGLQALTENSETRYQLLGSLPLLLSIKANIKWMGNPWNYTSRKEDKELEVFASAPTRKGHL